MNILDTNKKYVLASNSNATYLLQFPDLKVVKKRNQSHKIGSLQYATGIAVLCKGSLAIFYDFKYDKIIDSIDTYLKLVNICLLKNLLIAISQERIIIYDMIEKVNLCYVATYNGYRATINPDYYNLKLLYPIKPDLFEEKDIWNNNTKKLSHYPSESKQCYDSSGTMICFTEKIILSLYTNDEVIRGCSFEQAIEQVKPNTKKGSFFVKLENGCRFIEINEYTKSYLKPVEYMEMELENSESAMLIYEDSLYIWKGKHLYKTVEDTDYYFEKKEEISENKETDF